MAPTITSAMIYSNEHLTLTSSLLTKPLRDKLHRYRINNSIEQLKSLLGPEILNQQSDSKLEIADIQDLPVFLLRQQQQNQPVSSSSCSAAVNQGYSSCVQEIVHFLTKDEVKTQTQRRLLSHFQSLHPSSDKNRRESDLPQFSSQPSTAPAKRRVQSTLLSGGSGRVLQTGTPLSNKLNGPCWSNINVMDSDQRSSSYYACAGCFQSLAIIKTYFLLY
uniref:Orange domain-containing protein n=1 Tax=Oncorhynchus kisutch TaxID=8019 RepID=A0A8C7C9N9_ONCKI